MLISRVNSWFTEEDDLLNFKILIKWGFKNYYCTSHLVCWTPMCTIIVESLSRVWLIATPLCWTAARQAKASFIQFTLVAQSCPILCDPMESSIRGFPVHHQLLELAQTQVHRVSDAIQPFHPLSSPSPPTFNLSQHQGLLQWVSSSQQVESIGVLASTSGLPINTQDWSPLGWTGWISLQSKGVSRVFSNTTVQKHQFFSAQLSL